MSSSQSVNKFAKTDFRGRQTEFGIKNDDRARHVYVIGKTGMGKSTLLENMAIHDILAGEGMAFIDPHGKTAELLLDYVPQERIKDVVYFAPFDVSNPISFNVMEDVGKDQRYLVANGLMATFKKIWPDVWSSRMEYILNNTILALLEYPNSTLLGVNRMLSDKGYRDEVVANISDPSVRSFWLDEFAKYNERYMQEAGDAIKNKIGQFTSNPLIRNIVGQSRSTIDMRKIMDDKKILIINLSKGRVGEQNASLLGGMIITKIYLAAMSRANANSEELSLLPYFYFFVDEFQSFVNDSFADILSEARKYKLSLTIAHQYIEQMPETVRNAVFGNVGTTICFRIGPFDAAILEEMFMPTFNKEDLVNLGFAQIYLTMSIDGVGSPPFSATTLPPVSHPTESFKPRIIEFSRSAYSAPREKVEKEITDWHEEKHSPRKAEAASNKNLANKQPTKNDSAQFNKDNNKNLNKKDREIKISKPAETSEKAKAINPDQFSQPVSLNQLRQDRYHNAGKHREELRNALQEMLSSVIKEEEVKTASIKDVDEIKTAPPKNSVESNSPSVKDFSEVKSTDAESFGEVKEVPAETLKKILSGEE